MTACDGVQVQQDEEWSDWVRQAFKSLDTNQDGVICGDDMRMMTVDLDEVHQPVECLACRLQGLGNV